MHNLSLFTHAQGVRVDGALSSISLSRVCVLFVQTMRSEHQRVSPFSLARGGYTNTRILVPDFRPENSPLAYKVS